MFVRAAMAAYEPPLAALPQMDMTMKREPRSRAVLVATGWVVRMVSPLCERVRLLTTHGCVAPDRHGAWSRESDTESSSDNRSLL